MSIRGERLLEEFKAIDPRLNQAIQHMMGLPADRVLRAARGLLAKKVGVANQAPRIPEV